MRVNGQRESEQRQVVAWQWGKKHCHARSAARRATCSVVAHVGTTCMLALLTCAFAYGRERSMIVSLAWDVRKAMKVAAIPCGNVGIPIRCIQRGTAIEVVVPRAVPCYCTEFIGIPRLQPVVRFITAPVAVDSLGALQICKVGGQERRCRAAILPLKLGLVPAAQHARWSVFAGRRGAWLAPAISDACIKHECNRKLQLLQELQWQTMHRRQLAGPLTRRRCCLLGAAPASRPL
jgi:hypothetical protein